MPERTTYWKFSDTTERDSYGTPQGVVDRDLCIVDADSSIYQYDEGAASWIPLAADALSDVLVAGSSTGATSINITPGEGLEVSDTFGTFPTYVRSHKKWHTTVHTPSGSGTVQIGNPIFVPTYSSLGLEQFFGWIKLSGVVTWEDLTGSPATTTGDFFVFEGQIGLAGLSSPVRLEGLARSSIPGLTDFGAMQIAYLSPTGLILRARDWNDSIDRKYLYSVDLIVYDGREGP